MEEHGRRQRDQADEKGEIVFSGQPPPPPNHADQGYERRHEQETQQQGVERAAAEQVLRRDGVDPGRERGHIQQDEESAPQSCLKPKKPAVPKTFPTAVEQIGRQHGDQDRRE